GETPAEEAVRSSPPAPMPRLELGEPKPRPMPRLKLTEPGPSLGRPSRELAGLRALVTGSTGGIGKAIALEFAAAGAAVIVHGRRAEAAAAVANQVEAQGVACRVFLADLAEPEECRRLVEAAWEECGPLHVWVNNAGADVLTGEAADWSFLDKL